MIDNRFLAQLPAGDAEDAPAPRVQDPDEEFSVPREGMGRTQAIEIEPVEEPIPVYQAPNPYQYLNYGIQGLILSIVIAIGKPLIDRVSLLFSERARLRAAKEEKALDMQLKASETSHTLAVDQREFLQTFIEKQQDRMTQDMVMERESQMKRMETVFNKLDESMRINRNTNAILREISAYLADLNQNCQSVRPRIIPKVPAKLTQLPNMYPEEEELEEDSKKYPSSDISQKPRG